MTIYKHLKVTVDDLTPEKIAVMFHRKVAVSGRSMVNVIGLVTELGYLKIPKGVLVDINQAKNYPDREIVIITTGSQVIGRTCQNQVMISGKSISW